MRRVRERISGYFGIEVDSAGRSGGLAFLWRKDVDCTFISALIHHMDFRVRGEEGEWRILGFYGWPAVTDRHLSWELLRLLHSQSKLPWVCIADFNKITYSTEMKGGSRPQWQMNNFRNALDDCVLRCISWEGYNFSFDNGQIGEANRQSMLDRAVCSGHWADLFPFARLYYLAREWSDHAPIKLVLNRREVEGKRAREFKFEQIWVGEEGCGDAVARGVERGRGSLVSILEDCAKELKSWKGTSIQQIRRSIEGKLKQLIRLNEESRSAENVQKRKRLVAELAKLRSQEEPFWRVTEAMNEGLRREYSEEEIIEALNQMHPLKAPRPDGMNGLFYQTYWDLRHNSSDGFMALKLDMAKAYDRVEWIFLERVLRAMGFDRVWIRWVMDCVSTVSFSVLINGQPSHAFRPSRGLRQDDSIFFMKASIEEADVVSNILRRYESASGQLASLDKTTVSFSKGIPRQKRSNLATRLGLVEVEEQERYLELPNVVGRSKKMLTDILRDKLSKRLSGWCGKILSRASKEVDTAALKAAATAGESATGVKTVAGVEVVAAVATTDEERLAVVVAVEEVAAETELAAELAGAKTVPAAETRNTGVAVLIDVEAVVTAGTTVSLKDGLEVVLVEGNVLDSIV
ncbi:uncharacterized protein LOC141613122 [Silene latifolia]|uniref:uncharacterized protein LOC141613122 n=1 Tax=Silene latifolia TaxID=37657 RepID=UPI003D76A746